MIILQNGTAAFLHHDGKYLLIKRSKDKKTAPGVWSGIGGAIEPHELNNPEAACLREIKEETGISAEYIMNLRLRYIIIRRTANTMRQNYIYFGETDIEHFTDTVEGELHWIPENDLQITPEKLTVEQVRDIYSKLKLMTLADEAAKQKHIELIKTKHQDEKRGIRS